MFVLAPPSAKRVVAFVAAQRGAAFSYAEVGMTRGPAPPGYTVDHTRAPLGAGADAFRRAADALRAWRMTALGWVSVQPAGSPVAPGTNVAVVVRHYGFWSLNACRVVYAFDEDDEDDAAASVRRAGFAYGTLPDHGAVGEERFAVEWHRADDRVWYDLLAYSRPGHLLARLGHPLGRRLQRRFAAGSRRAMEAAVAGPVSGGSGRA